MLNEFMLVSGWVFWAIVAAALLLEVIFLWNDMDETPAPILLAVAAVAAAVLFTDAFKGVKVLWLLPAAGLYVVIGILWAIKKWWTYVTEKLADCRRRYPSSPEAFERCKKDSRPDAGANKQRIVTWMFLWPFSMSWWGLTWPRRFFSWLYEYISTTFDRITDRVWQA